VNKNRYKSSNPDSAQATKQSNPNACAKKNVELPMAGKGCIIIVSPFKLNFELNQLKWEGNKLRQMLDIYVGKGEN